MNTVTNINTRKSKATNHSDIVTNIGFPESFGMKALLKWKGARKRKKKGRRKMKKRRKRKKIRNKEKKFSMPKDNIITLVIIILDNVNKKLHDSLLYQSL